MKAKDIKVGMEVAYKYGKDAQGRPCYADKGTVKALPGEYRKVAVWSRQYGDVVKVDDGKKRNKSTVLIESGKTTWEEVVGIGSVMPWEEYESCRAKAREVQYEIVELRKQARAKVRTINAALNDTFKASPRVPVTYTGGEEKSAKCEIYVDDLESLLVYAGMRLSDYKEK